ncbi:cyclic-phosphate processing receiver domain-containing protein [Aliarcobacter butzleri]|uniref:cyclic-phosphate processing receiver domain-containing protein n=1 Tax=Aliarcobacter butzleri TaxID=28197 RepID=UPI0012F971DF|nr:cyclic-phosphate processing receiver domain-containing protein [Aliarcobacter butzleri]
MYTMFLDDIRTPKEKFDVITRSYDEAVNFVKENGIPNFISFDHDLGCDDKGNILKSGYDFAKWLVEQSLNEVLEFPKDFTFQVHSANPIGRNNINSILNNYLLFRVKLI